MPISTRASAPLAGVFVLSCSCAQVQPLETAPPVEQHQPSMLNPAPMALKTASPCPAHVREHLLEFRTDSSDNSATFSWVSNQGASVECMVEALRVVAERLDAESDPLVIADFCSELGTYAGFLDEPTRDAARRSYLRFPYFEHIASSYFIGLGHAQIDLRDHLQPLVRVDWSFPKLGHDDATWHYHLYLARLGDVAAHDALAKKIADTSSGNDVANFLTSVAELGTQGAREIVSRYVNDTRTTDGSSGPGQPVSERAKMLLTPGMHWP